MARKKDLVGTAFSELLVNDKFDYITTGVPCRVLEMKVAHEITLRTGESDFEHVQSKAKVMIDNEVKKETLVKSASGNYLAGPKSGKNDDDSNDMDQEGADEYEDEDDEDDEDDGEVKHVGDSDYSPSYGAGRRVPQRRGEGRVSARQKKSRFDSEDYVYPNKLKNFMKRTSPGTSPNKKLPRKRPGPKPKKRQPPTTCSICRNPEAEEEISVSCKSCPVKAHESCSSKELKGKPTAEWTCMYCTPRNNTKWKCAVCGGPPGKDLGVVVSCESCAAQYHKQCHSPPIPETKKLLNSWRCSNCPWVQRSKSPAVATPSATKRLSEASAPADSPAEGDDSSTQRSVSPPAHKKLPEGCVCDLCNEGFPNPVDRLVCIRCEGTFHSGCCRVRRVENVVRLGSRKNKWRCDVCVNRADKFLNGTLCFKCKGGFPNANDKASCSNCRLSFHARCCRAKEVANLTRLGSRKAKWRCDSCKFPKGRTTPKKEEMSDDETAHSNVDDSVDMDDGSKSVESEEDKADAWWKSRLRPIKVGSNQPPLGPIPDLSVPDIACWTAKEVREYFDDFFLDQKIGNVFIEHEIDGKALKLMRRNDIISTFQIAGFTLDVILDVILHVKRLQLRVNDRRYIWADIM